MSSSPPVISWDAVKAFIEAFPEAPISVIATSMDGTVEIWNPYAEVLYGFSAADALGRPVVDLTVGPVSAEEAQQIMEALLTGNPWAGSFVCQRRDGSTIEVAVVDIVAVDDDGQPRAIVGLSRELSGQLEVSLGELDEMRELANQLDEVRRDESRRIAGQLHDEFSQRLHQLVERTTAIEARGDLPEAARMELAELREMERELISTMQAMWGSLRPPLLDDFGVVAAVEHLLEDIGRLLPGLRWLPIDPGLQQASPEAAEVVVAVLQEGLTNVVKHARASSCDVSISVDGALVEVVVKDDGHGEAGPEGFGLRLMRERVRRQGGKFSFEACPSSGTQLRVQLPLSHEAS